MVLTTKFDKIAWTSVMLEWISSKMGMCSFFSTVGKNKKIVVFLGARAPQELTKVVSVSMRKCECVDM